MTYQPFLPEAAAGSIEPRHVVVPLRRVLRQVPPPHRPGHRASTTPPVRSPPSSPPATSTTVGYDVLVVAPGSVARTLPDPRAGRARHRVQDRRRGHLPAQPRAVAARRRGHHDRPGAAQAAADLPRASAAATPASRRSPSWRTWPATPPATTRTSTPDDLRWVLVEAAGRIMPEVGPKMGGYTVERLLERRHRGLSRHPGRSRWRTATSCSTTAPSSTPTPSSGPRASSPTRCSTTPTCRGTTAAGSSAPPNCRSSACPTCSARATAPSVPDLSKDDPEADDQPVGAARRAAGQGARRQHRRAPAAATRSTKLQAQLRRLGGEPRAVQGRRRDLRHQAARDHRVVHAPHLPREPDAHLEPPGPHRSSTGRARCSWAGRSWRWARSTTRGPSSTVSRTRRRHRPRRRSGLDRNRRVRPPAQVRARRRSRQGLDEGLDRPDASKGPFRFSGTGLFFCGVTNRPMPA